MFLIAGIAWYLAGCEIIPKRPSEPSHTFVLQAKSPAEPLPRGSGKAGILLVNLPRALPGFDTPQIAYVTRDHEVSYFAFNQWANTPAHMLLPLLVTYLSKTDVWDAVVEMPSPVRGDYQLSSENLLLQQEFFEKPSLVRLSLRMQLIRLRDDQVITTREFTVVEPAPTDDPYGGVQAANTAVDKLLKHIADWLALCIVEPGVGKCG